MAPTEKTVRVFISSTFRDMHAERDHLITVVFPELRERLERLGLELYDVDLRWGVPEKGLDGEKANSWAYCKQWIERVKPFFICLLGQRYGWIPPENEIQDEQDRALYKGLSITEMEIRHAVFSGKLHRRAFFYFRQAVVPEDAPPEIYHEFVDPDDQERLQRLKEDIDTTNRPIRCYDCSWTGKGFTDFEAFGRMVLEDLWSGVLRDERYVSKEAWRHISGLDPHEDPLCTDETKPLPPEVWEEIVETARPAPPNPLDAEAEQMAAFAGARLRRFHGRDRELKQLASFISDDLPSEASRVCVVRAVAGQGKSALLAKLAKNMADSPYLVITHFVGATERGTDTRTMLERLDQELERNGIPLLAEKEHKNDLESLRERFAERLENYNRQPCLVLLIDAVNQLSDEHDLLWLPRRLGASVRIVLSTIDDPAAGPESSEGRVLSALKARQPEPLWMDLQALDVEDVRQIVQEYLIEYCKQLDNAQIEMICQMEQARKPLYLLVMLNELRTLGGNDMNKLVPQLIAGMKEKYPDTTDLFEWVLERLEVFGVEAVKLWCTYLSLGRLGMSSQELSDLLARKLGGDSARTALLIERGLRRYLQRRGGQLDYFHGQLRQAVQRRYWPENITSYHADIAAYLGTRWQRPDLHAISELPYHQTMSESWEELEETLQNTRFLSSKEGEGMSQSLQQDFLFAIQHASGLGHIFFSCRIGELRSKLNSDIIVHRNPGTLGLLMFNLIRTRDMVSVNRMITMALRTSDPALRAYDCMELLLSGGSSISSIQREELTNAILGELALRNEITEPAWGEKLPHPNVIHGRAYITMAKLARLGDKQAIKEALKIYSALPNPWTITKYATSPQVVAAAERREQVDELLQVADQDPELAELMDNLLGGEEILDLVDEKKFITTGDYFRKIYPIIDYDVLIRVLHKTKRNKFLSMWMNELLNIEYKGNEMVRLLMRMRIELGCENTSGALRVLTAYEYIGDKPEAELAYVADMLQIILPLWIKYNQVEAVASQLRSLLPRIKGIKTPGDKLVLLTKWLPIAYESGWATEDVAHIWKQIVQLWKEYPDLWKDSDAARFGENLKKCLPPESAPTAEVRLIDEYVWASWFRVSQTNNPESWMFFAEYAREYPTNPELFNSVLEKLSGHIKSLLEEPISGENWDEAAEKALYFGEFITLGEPYFDQPGLSKVLDLMLEILGHLISDRRFVNRANSLLRNLSIRRRPEASILTDWLLNPSGFRESRVMKAISTGISALIQRYSELNLEVALELANHLQPGDYEYFDSVIMNSRTEFYDADFLNDQSGYEMIKVEGAPGAHTDAFDNYSGRDVRFILNIILSEALTQHGRIEEAKKMLESVIEEAKAESELPDIDGLQRYTTRRAANSARRILFLAVSIAERLNLSERSDVEFVNGDRESVDVILDSNCTFEQLFLLLCDSNTILLAKHSLICQLIARISEQPYHRYRFLLMLLLRGITNSREFAVDLRCNLDRKVLIQLLYMRTGKS